MPGALDIGGAKARAAWASNRRSSILYRGPLFRVRRNSDSTELDIYAIPGTGWCNVWQLAAFCSGTNGLVKTTYDGTGNGYHATQATTTKQPKVYDSATGPVLNGSNVSMRLDGVDDELRYSASVLGLSGSDFSYTVVFLMKYASAGGNLTAMASLGTLTSGTALALYGSAAAGQVNGVNLANKWSNRYRSNATYDNIWTPSPAVTAFHTNVCLHGTGEANSALGWRQNGVALTAAVTDPNAPSIDPAGVVYIGTHFGSLPMGGDLACMAVYPTKLAGSNLTRLEAQHAFMRAA